ncbi:MAG TPA: anthranilate phosphoribosyltransferase [Acidimicrobiia bacterium]|nr:anthranilate phosphoribosyltransferase [Acidimicrobiia bacterium]
MSQMLEDLLQGIGLTEDQAVDFVHDLIEGEVDPALAGAVLTALRAKGETPDEVRGFARAMRGLATDPMVDVSGAVDVVGTGGDRSGSLNLSTGSALVTASAGVPVVKHGNRSMTSRSGSADVLEALGLPMPMTEDQVRRLFEATGFTFLFAPYFHPAMAAVMPVRRALAVRTVFNILGPLTNPASPPNLVIGAFDHTAAGLMAGALSGLDIDRAFVVHGAEGWDEPSPLGEFLLFDVRPGEVVETTRDPADLGMPPCRPDDLAGGTPEQNARHLLDVLEGERGAHRDSIVLGAALALEVTGNAPGPAEAVEMAAAAIDEGKTLALANALDAFGADEATA